MDSRDQQYYEINNEWPLESIMTLEAWKKQLGFRMAAHIHSQRWYKKFHKSIKIPNSICTTLLGASAITSLSNDPTWSSAASSVTLVLTILIAILTALDTVFKPEHLGERHKMASDNFQKIIRTVNQILVLVGGTHTTFKPSPYVTLNNIREQIDNAISASPVLPPRFDSSLAGFDLVKLLIRERKKRTKREEKLSRKAEIHRLRVGAGINPTESSSGEDLEKGEKRDDQEKEEKFSFQMIEGNMIPCEYDPKKKDYHKPEIDISLLMSATNERADKIFQDEHQRMEQEIKRLADLHQNFVNPSH
jgi:hypothetical protein